MSKITEKQQNKRTNILDAAYELFIEKSFNNTSIDDVVKRAGIAKGTFYLYFKDKHDLVERIIIRKSALILRLVLDELKKEKETNQMSFPDQMEFITDKIVDYLVEHKEIITLMGKNFSSCLSYFNTIEGDELKELLDELIQENAKNGFSEEETLQRIYLIVALVGSVCYDSLVYESPFKISEIKPLLFSSVKNIISEKTDSEYLQSVNS
jgi:AcrR family transcriptional regulator